MSLIFEGYSGRAHDLVRNRPIGGLWAYRRGKFYALKLDPKDRKTDHTSWFRSIGLPDYGKAYDEIMRGRVTWDRHFEHYVLTYYGTRCLPNQVYELVTRHFDTIGKEVVERPASRHWA